VTNTCLPATPTALPHHLPNCLTHLNYLPKHPCTLLPLRGYVPPAVHAALDSTPQVLCLMVVAFAFLMNYTYKQVQPQ
jgi:hypothetical protein